jgi:ATP-dependent RNA helicase RhlE
MSQDNVQHFVSDLVETRFCLKADFFMNQRYSRGRSFNRFSNNRANRFNRGLVQRKPFGRGSFAQNINPARFVNKAVITTQEEVFVPANNFSDFNLNPKLMANIFAKGYKIPTAIQDKIIPHILKGLDVVGVANTGTGKTGAFLIPLIEKVIKNKNEKILILAPTRELALQTNAEFKSFSRGLNMYSACCVGGASIRNQFYELKYENEFIIGTPGRVKDLIERKMLNLSHFSTIVLDEADRMLDMGFINDTRAIISYLSKPRHTLFFSATMGREIESLVGEFLVRPVTVSVKSAETPEGIEQDVVKVGGADKVELLYNLLIKEEFKKILIFGRTKYSVERLSKTLQIRGFSVESIHGNKIQSKRQRALEAFKKDSVKILVATDIAARGLDIPDVTHVINFDVPATYEDYVHRIGRTGRANKRGKALTFIN